MTSTERIGTLFRRIQKETHYVSNVAVCIAIDIFLLIAFFFRDAIVVPATKDVNSALSVFNIIKWCLPLFVAIAVFSAYIIAKMIQTRKIPLEYSEEEQARINSQNPAVTIDYFSKVRVKMYKDKPFEWKLIRLFEVIASITFISIVWLIYMWLVYSGDLNPPLWIPSVASAIALISGFFLT